MTGETDPLDASASGASSSRNAPPEPRPWVRRHRLALIAGAILGGPYGAYTGWVASKGGIFAVSAVVVAATVGLLYILLVIVAAVARKPGPAIAAPALAAAFLVGLVVAPDAPGSTQSAPGTGTAGTRADPAALWSGPVSCQWPKDESTHISQVRGFEVPITDAAFTAAEKLNDFRASIVNLQPRNGSLSGSVFYEGTRTDHSYREAGTYGVDLEGVSADGRTGTAVFTRAGGVVFQWRCSGGP